MGANFFALRRQSFCERHFDELFKRSFAFVDPRANQSAFPAIQNERGKCASRKVLGDLALCLCLGNDVRDHRRPSRKPLGNTGTNHLALLGKFGSKITQQAATTELLFFSHLNQPLEIFPETSVRRELRVAEHGLGLIAAFEIARDDLGTEIFFALEMIVKRALGYTRGFGNVLHAGGIESSLVQDPQAGIEEKVSVAWLHEYNMTGHLNYVKTPSENFLWKNGMVSATAKDVIS